MDDRFSHINPDEEVSIINPTADDFSLEVTDIHHKGDTITYTVKARESLKLPRYAADHVSERLAQKMESRKSGVLTQAYHQQLLGQIRMYKEDE
jgi:hypothetical protein